MLNQSELNKMCMLANINNIQGKYVLVATIFSNMLETEALV